jgi:hypothetical protein
MKKQLGILFGSKTVDISSRVPWSYPISLQRLALGPVCVTATADTDIRTHNFISPISRDPSDELPQKQEDRQNKKQHPEPTLYDMP